jgi:hypothetical protein
MLPSPSSLLASVLPPSTIVHRYHLAALAGFFALGLGSCTAIVSDVEKSQCAEDRDCSARGLSGATCQDSVCVVPSSTGDPYECSAVTPSSSDTVTFTFSAGYAAAPDSPSPFTIVACDRLDVECDSPLTDPPVMANAGEPVAIEVKRGFSGYFRIQNADTVPARYFMGQALTRDTTGWDLTIASPAIVSALGLATGTTIDVGKGVIIVGIRGCDGERVAGAVASNSLSDENTVGFYFASMFPERTLSSTTSEGAAGFVNVPPGSALIGAKASGHSFEPSAVLSEGGWISYVEVFP